MRTRTHLFDIEKMFNDIREQLFHDVVNDSSLIFEVNEGKIKGELVVPGFKKEEISIRAHPKYIDISGKMDEKRFRRLKTSFHQKLNFPQRINPDTVKVKLIDGVLSFEVMLEEAKEVKVIDF